MKNEVVIGQNGNSCLGYFSWLKNRKDGVKKLVVVTVGGDSVLEVPWRAGLWCSSQAWEGLGRCRGHQWHRIVWAGKRALRARICQSFSWDGVSAPGGDVGTFSPIRNGHAWQKNPSSCPTGKGAQGCSTCRDKGRCERNSQRAAQPLVASLQIESRASFNGSTKIGWGTHTWESEHQGLPRGRVSEQCFQW